MVVRWRCRLDHGGQLVGLFTAAAIPPRWLCSRRRRGCLPAPRAGHLGSALRASPFRQVVRAFVTGPPRLSTCRPRQVLARIQGRSPSISLLEPMGAARVEGTLVAWCAAGFV